MIVLIDNYDSFTFNLVHYLGELGADVVVHRNDKIAVADVLAAEPEAIVLSPGPCTPNEAGICLDLIEQAAPTIPILGVCLGHQAIGQAFGGEVVRAPAPVHGKLSRGPPSGRGRVPRHQRPVQGDALSLAGGRARQPAGRAQRHRRNRRRLVMGLAHRTLPVHGVQFHPESIASEHGHLILKNFLDLAAQWNARPAGARRRAGKQPLRRRS